MARKNIKVPEDLFLALRDDKDDQQSWPHYLEEQCLHGDGDGVDVDRIMNRIDDLESRIPRKVAEELR